MAGMLMCKVSLYHAWVLSQPLPTCSLLTALSAPEDSSKTGSKRKIIIQHRIEMMYQFQKGNAFSRYRDRPPLFRVKRKQFATPGTDNANKESPPTQGVSNSGFVDPVSFRQCCMVKQLDTGTRSKVAPNWLPPQNPPISKHELSTKTETFS